MPDSIELLPLVTVSRRTLISWAAGAAGFTVLPQMVREAKLLAQQPAAGAPRSELVPLNRFSRMVQEWFVDQVRAAEDRIKERLAAVKTKADAEAYVRLVQGRIRECFGPEPERTPLNARVTGAIERDA